MKFNVPNFIAGIIISIFGIIFFLLSLSIDGNSNEIFNASFMPKAYTLLITVFGCTIIINSFRDKENNQTLREYKGPIAIILLTIVYVIAIPLIGYYLSTIIMILSFLLIVKFENKVLMILTPFIASGLMYIIFEVLLNVPIPTGALFS